MKKLIIILFLMSSFFINVCIVNAETKEELEKKYEFFSKMVEQDIEFIKNKINLIKGEYTESEVLDKLIEEVTNNKINTSRSSYNYTSLGTALPGAIFYTPAVTSGINHGHVGIYVSNDKIAEAPGSNYYTRVIESRFVTVVQNETDIYIVSSATNSQKLGAADWARELALLSRPYNDAFWANKSCETTDNYNCSQLVWCAYNAITTINLDYNGGFGVYPNDIISSNNLTYATTY